MESNTCQESFSLDSTEHTRLIEVRNGSTENSNVNVAKMHPKWFGAQQLQSINRNELFIKFSYFKRSVTLTNFVLGIIFVAVDKQCPRPQPNTYAKK